MAHPRKEIDIELARRLYEEAGCSLDEVAEVFDTTNTTIRKRFIENGIEIRRPGFWHKIPDYRHKLIERQTSGYPQMFTHGG